MPLQTVAIKGSQGATLREQGQVILSLSSSMLAEVWRYYSSVSVQYSDAKCNIHSLYSEGRKCWFSLENVQERFFKLFIFSTISSILLFSINITFQYHKPNLVESDSLIFKQNFLSGKISSNKWVTHPAIMKCWEKEFS